MRQLWATGWMHNRVRMVVASFLIKHLLLDWRHGEKWFWDTLVDADLANNAAVATMVSRMPHPYTASDAADFVRRSNLGEIGKCVYAITKAENGEFLGCCALEPHLNDPQTLEIGYWLGEPFWNHGYATEAAHALIDMAFRTRDIDQIDARCRVTNIASRRVIQKCGFQFQGTGMVGNLAMGGPVPVEWYRLDRKTWLSLKSWGEMR